MSTLLIFLAGHWPQIINAAKSIGYIGGAVGTIYGFFRYLKKAFRTIEIANDSLNLLMTNHLPHMQNTMKEHGDLLQDIKSDVRNLETVVTGNNERLEDTKKAVHSLGEAFVKHLENSSKEVVPVEVAVPTRVRKYRRVKAI